VKAIRGGAEYAIPVLSVAVAALATALAQPWMGPSISLFFFPAIVITSVYGGYGPGLLATLLSTAVLAFFFVPPYNSFNIGTDDALRLIAFAVVAVLTAYLGAARRRAEDAQRLALTDLQRAVDTLRKVIGWPVFVDASFANGARKVVQYAAGVVKATRVVAVWEADEEPWVYSVASDEASGRVERQPPTALAPTIARLEASGLVSASFALEHVKGRVFFAGIAGPGDAMPLVEVVAREVGNSLDQLYVQEGMQQVAIREDRLRVARDLHDGVLQSLTGIRLQLHELAATGEPAAPVRERLLAVERAIALDQRDLRTFIDGLKPSPKPRADGPVAERLEELRARLGREWKTSIAVRVTPIDLSLPPPVDDAVRLMVREAVVNALQHAHPSRVSVDVQRDDGGPLRIVVSDDGRGFPFRGRVDQSQLDASNVGPVSLRERVVALSGSMAIESTAAGSRLEITLPA